MDIYISAIYPKLPLLGKESGEHTINPNSTWTQERALVLVKKPLTTVT